MSSDQLPRQTAHPPERTLLIWDGDCGFCRRSVERLQYQVGDRVEFAPYQEVGNRFPDIEEAELVRGSQLVEPDGRVFAAAHAILRTGARADGWHPVYWLYTHAAWFAALTDWVYSKIAKHRRAASRVSRWLVGDSLRPQQYRLTRWLILRLLGVTAFLALWSYMGQIDGLVGPDGIMPAGDYLDWRAQIAADQDWSWLQRLTDAPTLAWLGSSTLALETIALVGMVLALLLVLDLAPMLCLVGIWLCYLSLVVVSGPFLPFQWDTLLLETLVCAMFLAPWRLRPQLAGDREPTPMGIWMMRLLVFKLMLLSGLVKLQSGDGTWTELTSLDYHFFTQPIPTWTSYYAHHAPELLHRLGVVFTFVAEVGLPLLLLTPRKLRRWFFAGTLLLMLGIGATGNYGFFNLLTVVIALSLLDDDALARLVPRRLRRQLPDRTRPPARPRLWVRRTAVGLALPLLLLGGVQSIRRVAPKWQPPELLEDAVKRTYRFHSTNSYGLFAGMTRQRPEVVIEGSLDGVDWQPYRFHYKVQSVDEVPSVAFTHMPRLDWQMWFVALSGCRSGRSRWFHNFLERLLHGDSAVLGLLERAPFADQPPRYLRTWLYYYSFAGDPRLGDEQLEEGRWWRRQLRGPFCPTATLDQTGRLRWLRAQPRSAR